jgi:hypothetical protein
LCGWCAGQKKRCGLTKEMSRKLKDMRSGKEEGKEDEIQGSERPETMAEVRRLLRLVEKMGGEMNRLSGLVEKMGGGVEWVSENEKGDEAVERFVR